MTRLCFYNNTTNLFLRMEKSTNTSIGTLVPDLLTGIANTSSLILYRNVTRSATEQMRHFRLISSKMLRLTRIDS